MVSCSPFKTFGRSTNPRRPLESLSSSVASSASPQKLGRERIGRFRETLAPSVSDPTARSAFGDPDSRPVRRTAILRVFGRRSTILVDNMKQYRLYCVVDYHAGT